MSWIVLELRPRAETIDPDTIRDSIRARIAGADVFIPAALIERGNQRVIRSLMDGYVFLRDRFSAQLDRLQDHPYIVSPSLIRRVSQAAIRRMRAQLAAELDQCLQRGDMVTVIAGPYARLPGEVRDLIDPNDVLVLVRLLSTDRLLMLPRSFVRPSGDPRLC